MNLNRNVFTLVDNSGNIKHFIFNTMQSYQLSSIDEKDIDFSPLRRSGNGFMVKAFLRKEGENVPLLIKGPSPEDEKKDIPPNWCFCYGFKTWENKDKRKSSSQTTGIIVRSVDNPKPYQSQWIHDYKEKIVMTFARELVRIKDIIRKPTLTLNSEVFGSSQFSRLEEKSGDSILNLKIDDDTELLSYPTLEHVPFGEMFGKRSNVKFEMRIDGVYVGANGTTIQVKLDRACVAGTKQLRSRAPMNITIASEDEVHDEKEDEVGIPIDEEDVLS
jgi:hypothetical protein